MSDEIYTKEEHYQDWKSENLLDLKNGFLKENEIEFNEFADLTNLKDEFLEEKADDFEAYCRQAFKDRD